MLGCVLDNDEIQSFVVSKDQQTVVTCGDRACVWNIGSLSYDEGSMNISTRGVLNCRPQSVMSLEFLDNHRAILGYKDHSARIWNVFTFEEMF